MSESETSGEKTGLGEILRIRMYQVGDRERVKELTIEGFEGVSLESLIERRWPGSRELPWGERKFLEVDADLTAHPEQCFVAELDGRVVGFITTRISELKRQGQIPDLVVDRSVRGKGIGRALLTHALAFFRERGMRIARIETLAHNDIGAHLYPSLGFELIATQNHYAMALEMPRGE